MNFLTTSVAAAAVAVAARRLAARHRLRRRLARRSARAATGACAARCAGGDLSSWALLGEYQAQPRSRACVRASACRTARRAAIGEADRPRDRSSRRVAERRRRLRCSIAGSVRPVARARLRRSRLDRYDYVASSTCCSARGSARASRCCRARLASARASQRMVAPGADEFLPPPSAGPWLPPERTFSSLVARRAVPRRARAPLRARPRARVRRAGRARGRIAVRALPAGGRRTRSRRCSASTRRATSGTTTWPRPATSTLDGWARARRRQLARRTARRASTTPLVDADWTRGRRRPDARASRAVGRPARPASGCTTSPRTLDADDPRDSTRHHASAIAFNTAFSRADADGGRRPGRRRAGSTSSSVRRCRISRIRGGRLEACVFAVRTLFRDDERQSACVLRRAPDGRAAAARRRWAACQVQVLTTWHVDGTVPSMPVHRLTPRLRPLARASACRWRSRRSSSCLAIINIALVKTWRGEPEDGVLWRDERRNVVATEIAPGTAAARAPGCSRGDVLLRIDGREVTQPRATSTRRCTRRARGPPR